MDDEFEVVAFNPNIVPMPQHFPCDATAIDECALPLAVADPKLTVLPSDLRMVAGYELTWKNDVSGVPADRVTPCRPQGVSLTKAAKKVAGGGHASALSSPENATCITRRRLHSSARWRGSFRLSMPPCAEQCRDT